jgi:hypothetical protein
VNGFLSDRLLDTIIEHVGIYLTGEEAQVLTDAILELLDEWFSTDIYA